MDYRNVARGFGVWAIALGGWATTMSGVAHAAESTQAIHPDGLAEIQVILAEKAARSPDPTGDLKRGRPD